MYLHCIIIDYKNKQKSKIYKNRCLYSSQNHMKDWQYKIIIIIITYITKSCIITEISTGQKCVFLNNRNKKINFGSKDQNHWNFETALKTL